MVTDLEVGGGEVEARVLVVLLGGTGTVVVGSVVLGEDPHPAVSASNTPPARTTHPAMIVRAVRMRVTISLSDLVSGRSNTRTGPAAIRPHRYSRAAPSGHTIATGSPLPWARSTTVPVPPCSLGCESHTAISRSLDPTSTALAAS